MREKTSQRSDDTYAATVKIPWDANTINVLRDFLAGRARSAKLYLRQLQRQRPPDTRLICVVATELRIARLWQRQLVSESELSTFVKEEYRNDETRVNQ